MIAELKRRCERAATEPGQGRDTALHLDRLAAQWHDEARRCEQERRQLNYEARSSEPERGPVALHARGVAPRPLGDPEFDAECGRDRCA